MSLVETEFLFWVQFVRTRFRKNLICPKICDGARTRKLTQKKNYQVHSKLFDVLEYSYYRNKKIEKKTF